jgi:5-methylcytosine-specific restriction endonuclease McrA
LLARGPAIVAARVGDSEAERSRIRDVDQPWRKWYYTARWRKLAKAIRQRDGDVCQQTGVKLIAKAPAPHSPVVDHKIPHNGDERLFWDPNNLQTVSKAWHDGEKQKQDKARARGLL